MKDELFLLVKSMTKAEKRYFSVQSGTFGNEAPTYLRLFQAMQQQTVYDEEAIKNTFAKEVFIKQLSTTKNTLLNKLLSSLRNYHSKSSIPQQLRENLDHLEVLWAKKAYKTMLKLLRRSKTIATEYEEFSLLYFFIQKERLYLVSKKVKHIEQEIERLAKEENQVLQQIKLESQFKQLEASVFVYLKIKLGEQQPELIASWERISQHPLLQSEASATTFRSRCCYHDIKGYFYTRTQNPSLAHHHYLQVINCWDQQPQFKKSEETEYLKALCNYMNGCYLAKEQEGYSATLQQLRAASKVLGQLAPKEIQTICYHEILYALSNKKIEEGLERLPQILRLTKQASANIHKSRLIVIYYNASALAYIGGDIQQATDLLQTILALPKVDARRDVLRFSRLFLSLLYYDLDLWELASSYHRSAYRGIAQPTAFEACLLTQLRALLKLDGSTKQEKQAFYAHFLSELEGLDAASHGALGFEEIQLWLQSKIMGRTVLDLYLNGG